MRYVRRHKRGRIGQIILSNQISCLDLFCVIQTQYFYSQSVYQDELILSRIGCLSF